MRLANAVLVDRSGQTAIRANEHYRVESPSLLRVEPCFVFEAATFSLRIQCEEYENVTTHAISRDTIALFCELLIEPSQIFLVECLIDGRSLLRFSIESDCVASEISVLSFTEREESKYFINRSRIQGLPFDFMLSEAHSHLNRRQAKLVFITGSVGKTTTKELVGSLLSCRLPTIISTDSWNFPHEICSQIVNNVDWSSLFVMEAALGRHLTAMGELLPPDILVVTHIGHAHTSFSGDLSQLARQKLALAAGMRKGGTIIFDGDQEFVKQIIYQELKPVITRDVKVTSVSASNSPEADIRATRDGEDICIRTDYSEIRFKAGAEEIPLVSIGCSYAIWRELGGTETSEFERVISSFSSVPGRLEKIQIGRVRVINDAYNANPASMTRFLSTLASERRAGKRVFAVVGEMLDLGDLSEEMHASIANCALKSSDSLLLCGSVYAKWHSDHSRSVQYLESPSQLDILNILKADLPLYDVFAFKGSLATGIFGVARAFQQFLSLHYDGRVMAP